MSLSAKIREQLISSFRAELAEHVQTMNDGFLALEQNRVAGEERRALLEDVFRAAHSLKGAARAIGVTAIEQLAHALEDVLAAIQNDALALTPGLFTACYHAVDAIQGVQTSYEAGEITPPRQALNALADMDPYRKPADQDRKAEPDPADEEPVLEPESQPAKPTFSSAEAASTPAVPAPVGDETIRVSVSKLDALMAQLSELLVTKIRAEQRLTQMRQAQVFLSDWQKDWFAVRSSYSRLMRKERQASSAESAPKQDRDFVRLMAYIEESQDRLRDLSSLMGGLAREYDNDVMHQALVIDSLEQEVKRVRMLPLNTITGTFGRMVRDLARAAGKEAVLEIVGGEVELDKRVLEQIKDPLVHLLRNAIDHGIEMPAERVARGKAQAGIVTLRAEQLGKDVTVSVSDDGAGLDIEAIRRVAMRRGLAGTDATRVNDGELTELIFHSGFSTSPIITDVSGRGVGLDVVRRNVELLGGRINVSWQPGRGSTFALTLPLALTSSRGLLVSVASQVFAIPLNAIERILYLRPDQIEPLGGHETVRYEGRPLALVRLSDTLGLSSDINLGDGRIPVVVVAAAERRMAFAVDGLVGEQEVVIKGLGRQLVRVGGIAGATIVGSGEVVLILNISDLMKLALKGERRSVLQAATAAVRPEERRERVRILIVDDSVTTRTLEKNILEAAGYAIQIATDGQEALNTIASTGVPDLIISDVSMPRLDGFGLTKRVKGDPRTANVPVILVTSLDSPEDKSKGIEAGADAYIVKSRFDQNNLLETIEQLI